MAEQDVDEVAAALYAVEPAAFVAARNAAVQQARDAGDRDLAAAIGRLRRPTMSAWTVNLLVRSAAAEVTELLALGEELRAAQQRLQGERLRQLAQRRREVVGVLARRARQLAAEAGRPLTDATTVEVEQTLAAALADPEAAEAVRAGQLTRALHHVGLGAEPLVALPPDSPASDSPALDSRTPAGQQGSPPSSPSADDPSADDPSADDPSADDPSADDVARHRQRRAVRVARDLAQARQELDEATARATLAEQQVRAAAERFAEVERQIVELQRERERAERERADAQRRARSAARVRDEAERRVQRLTKVSGCSWPGTD
ncbi:MAG: hypothetical protein ACRDSL_19145 [Pseudonocardiaceae bacterium]